VPPWLIVVFGAFVLLVLLEPCREMIGAALISGPGSADYSLPLPGGLALDRSSGKRHVIGWIDGAADDHVAKRDLYGVADSAVLIDADVTALGWNERYIVCEQSLSDLARDPTTGWWIIDTEKHERVGPLVHDEFLRQVARAGIMPLVIRAPDDWRNQTR